MQAVSFLLADNVPSIMSSWVARKCEELGKRMNDEKLHLFLQACRKGVCLSLSGRLA